MEILRNLTQFPGGLAGFRIFADKVTNSDGSTHNYVLETYCTKILFAVAFTGTTVIAATVGSSTTHSGTKTVTFAMPGSGTNSGVMYYLVIGDNEGLGEEAVSGAVTEDENGVA